MVHCAGIPSENGCLTTVVLRTKDIYRFRLALILCTKSLTSSHLQYVRLSATVHQRTLLLGVRKKRTERKVLILRRVDYTKEEIGCIECCWWGFCCIPRRRDLGAHYKYEATFDWPRDVGDRIVISPSEYSFELVVGLEKYMKRPWRRHQTWYVA